MTHTEDQRKEPSRRRLRWEVPMGGVGGGGSGVGVTGIPARAGGVHELMVGLEDGGAGRLVL